MRTVILAVLVLTGAGCGVELLATTAIHAELQAENMKALQKHGQHAADMSARINLERAVKTYQAEQGRWPASFEELVPTYLPSIPVKPDGAPYGYNPATGDILDAPMGLPVTITEPTLGDIAKMETIREAINSYGTRVGFYPPSLAALVPSYLNELPKTDKGEDFLYRCEDGALTHPADLRPPSKDRPVRTAPPAPIAGGAGPLGETVTGIGVQQQLNGMSHAGASSAGGYAREKTGGITGGHNAQQEQAMDNLGL